ncbi:hypothetical protein EQH89_06255 [Lacticaseibacillus paracasei]|uniref:type IIL restriction-modification enzyme MmeI n=1 Tax=Lacticaseibacillus paracasei TaxID=1597 RepID=UPI000FF39612|nr:type IIL restriction-modification enzyme MmeI [Lacticaseibacillus paracasei]RWZ62697.1 hypothetical protein EQH89_06255 [Lacticaseibacillus paracasei]
MVESILSPRSLIRAISEIDWDEQKLESERLIFLKWANSLDAAWGKKNETELTNPFYSQILVGVLGYVEGPQSEYTIAYENRTKTTTQKPDVVLGKFDDLNPGTQPTALIEFESPATSLDEKEKGVGQAFRYQSQYVEPVRWIIASNFREIRIYDRTREHVETFDIHALANDDNQIKRLHIFLGAPQIVGMSEADGVPLLDELVENNVAEQERISKAFYSDYVEVRRNVEQNITENNPDVSGDQAFSYA